MIGSQFGPYEIVSPLGAGGMGEVYRAKDSRLQRDVALKILPADIRIDTERQKRFLQEARAASALNHPNILSVFDVGTEKGSQFIVSELIEGESLRRLIQKGPVPLKKFLDIAIQIADGLAAAHEAGIVHRDLKPENIMISREGRVKILDFGLAKPVIPMQGTAQEETRSALLTGAGVILGTISYMSPEQARGQEVDFRSDQFSLGLILYEMATGRQAFQRDTPVQTLSAIISEDPRPISDLNNKIPAAIRWEIERCLAKDPRERYGATIDLYHELRNLREHLSETSYTSAGTVAVKPRPKLAKWLLAGGAMLACLLAGFLLSLRLFPGDRSDISSYRFRPLATNEGLEAGGWWSPDGKSIAYMREVNGLTQIFVQNLATASSLQITRSETECFGLGWSPDGTRFYYVAVRKRQRNVNDLWAVSAAGGSAELILENVSSGTLSPDGKTLFFLRQDTSAGGFQQSIWTSSPPGNKPQRFTRGPVGSQSYLSAELNFSPDGTKIAALLFSPAVNAAELWMIPFPKGEPRKISPRLTDAQVMSFSWLPDNRHIVFAADPNQTRRMHLWMTDTEKEIIRPVTTGIQNEVMPFVSPDGKQIAFTSAEPQYDLIEVPLDGSPIRRLSSSSWEERGPTWSPGGELFVYVSDRLGSDILWIKGKSEGSERPLVTGADFADKQTTGLSRPAFSPEGLRIAYHRNTLKGGDIWISVLEGGTPVKPFPEDRGQFCPTWSPDGNWLAYLYKSGGKYGIAKGRIGSGQSPVTLVENVLYFAPQWSPKGDWISYQTKEGLLLVSVDGKIKRSVSKLDWLASGWSKDGSNIYGVRQDDLRHLLVASIDLQSGKEKIVSDVGTSPLLLGASPLVGFSLSPDGKSFATSLFVVKGDIWLMEGFEQASGFLSRLQQR